MGFFSRRGSRRFFIPEVVQTSAMDCGPASLKCLLEGFGIDVSYGRLREVCHTDVDGSSISTMASVAGELGLEAEEIMLPADHVFLEEANALPAIAVMRLPNGSTHFSVLWRRHGPLCQVMDPASGRVWKSVAQIQSELHAHVMTVPAEAWREWAASEEFLGSLRRRLRAIGVSASQSRLIAPALADPTWESLGALDAAVRFAAVLGRRRLGSDARAAALIAQLAGRRGLIPSEWWSVEAVQGQSGVAQELRFRGAVVVRAKRRTTDADGVSDQAQPSHLAAAVAETQRSPSLSLFRILRNDGYLNAGFLLMIWLIQATGVAVEAVLFRGLFGVSAQMMSGLARLEVLAGVAGFAALMVLVTFPGTMSVLRYGRLIENRLRLALFLKLPRLGDRYFQSRVTADVAERAHSINHLRVLPHLASTVIGSFNELLLTTAGIIWLDPRLALLALVACACSIAVPLAVQPLLAERDLRVRAHVGALARFYLESMVGLTAIRAHSAEAAIRSEQRERLAEWMRASLRLLRAAVTSEGLQLVLGTAFATAILLRHLSAPSNAGTSLLLVYWSLNLPMIGAALANAVRQYPIYRNITLRLFEPLAAPENAEGVASEKAAPRDIAEGVALSFNAVQVAVSGYTILDDVRLEIEPGEHVAIVGRSGAGKSSLVGLLLGWYAPSQGAVRIDGSPLDPGMVAVLRRETAWVDPAIHIWNQSLYENLRYGAATTSTAASTATLIERADLMSILGTLPEGMQTPLGEGGGLVSGGEGQRVRLGRAMNRADARLVILDEAFRGLDAAKRALLIARSRDLWSRATMLCITHDIHDTLDFSRVVVLDAGRVVEDGDPRELAARTGSLYARLLEQQAQVKAALLDPSWRKLRVEGGRLSEG